MLRQSCKSLLKLLVIIDVEYEIQLMEAELSYHIGKTRIIEEILQNYQHILSELKRSKNENCVVGDMQ